MNVKKNAEQLRLLIAAGGTGGHITPALAVYECLKERLGSDLHVQWIGSDNRLESTLVPSYGIPFTPMPIRGFSGVFSTASLQLPFRLLKSFTIAKNLIKSFQPHIVLATGAYISYPVGKAAGALGVPLVLMESNVNVGKSNQQLLSTATYIALSYDATLEYVPRNLRQKAEVVGNPVRRAVLRLPAREAACKSLGFKVDAPVVVVMGGSLGARSINNAIQNMISKWETEGKAPFQILWQTGTTFKPVVPEVLKPSIVHTSFIGEVGQAYAAADVVLCRSGATTIAELCVAEKPAVLVPLPSASMNEQNLNAQMLAQAGAARVITDEELESKVESILLEMIRSEDLTLMSKALQQFAKPVAAETIANAVIRIANEKGGRG